MYNIRVQTSLQTKYNNNWIDCGSVKVYRTGDSKTRTYNTICAQVPLRLYSLMVPTETLEYRIRGGSTGGYAVGTIKIKCDCIAFFDEMEKYQST